MPIDDIDDMLGDFDAMLEKVQRDTAKQEASKNANPEPSSTADLDSFSAYSKPPPPPAKSPARPTEATDNYDDDDFDIDEEDIDDDPYVPSKPAPPPPKPPPPPADPDPIPSFSFDAPSAAPVGGGRAGRRGGRNQPAKTDDDDPLGDIFAARPKAADPFAAKDPFAPKPPVADPFAPKQPAADPFNPNPKTADPFGAKPATGAIADPFASKAATGGIDPHGPLGIGGGISMKNSGSQEKLKDPFGKDKPTPSMAQREGLSAHPDPYAIGKDKKKPVGGLSDPFGSKKGGGLSDPFGKKGGPQSSANLFGPPASAAAEKEKDTGAGEPIQPPAKAGRGPAPRGGVGKQQPSSKSVSKAMPEPPAARARVPEKRGEDTSALATENRRLLDHVAKAKAELTKILRAGEALEAAYGGGGGKAEEGRPPASSGPSNPPSRRGAGGRPKSTPDHAERDQRQIVNARKMLEYYKKEAEQVPKGRRRSTAAQPHQHSPPIALTTPSLTTLPSPLPEHSSRRSCIARGRRTSS